MFFRWIPYKACGKLIEGTKIICFKVPLKRVSFYSYLNSVFVDGEIVNIHMEQLNKKIYNYYKKNQIQHCFYKNVKLYRKMLMLD